MVADLNPGDRLPSTDDHSACERREAVYRDVLIARVVELEAALGLPEFTEPANQCDYWALRWGRGAGGVNLGPADDLSAPPNSLTVPAPAYDS